MPFGNSRGQGFNTPVLLNFAAGNTIINPNGYFQYDGSPAAGNLIYSNTSATGTDKFGNNYLAGESFYNNIADTVLNIYHSIITFYTMSGNPGATFASVATMVLNRNLGLGLYGLGITGFIELITNSGTSESIITNDTLGVLNYQATGSLAADSNTYHIGEEVLFSTSPTTINSTAGNAVNNLNTQVAARSYFMRCMLRCVAGAGVTQVMAPQLTGTATLSGTQRVFTKYFPETAGTTVTPGNIGSLNANPGVLPAAIPNGTVFDWELEGVVTFSAAGTFGIQGVLVTSNADETFTIQTGSYLKLRPV